MVPGLAPGSVTRSVVSPIPWLCLLPAPVRLTSRPTGRMRVPAVLHLCGGHGTACPCGLQLRRRLQVFRWLLGNPVCRWTRSWLLFLVCLRESRTASVLRLLPRRALVLVPVPALQYLVGGDLILVAIPALIGCLPRVRVPRMQGHGKVDWSVLRFTLAVLDVFHV